jgi:diguanylate cyclase
MDSAPESRPTDPGEDKVLSSAPVRAGRWVVGGLAGTYAASTLLPPDLRPAGIDTWFYSLVLVAVVLSGLVRPLLVRRNRLPWLLLSVATISWAAGDVYWSIAFADAEEIPVPSPADVFYVGLYPLAYFGLVLLARSVLRRVPASIWLDGLVTSLAAGALFSAFTVKQIISVAEGSLPEVLTNLSYPVGDLVLIVIAVATLAMVRWRADPTWWLLVVGFALFAVADTAYLFGVANGTYEDGRWVDGLWMVGIALVPIAGSLRQRAAAPAIRGLAALLVPILFSTAALIVLLVGAFVELHPVTVVLAGACLLAAGARTAMTFEQTKALARSRTEAMTDELTTLGNRRLLDTRLPALAADATTGQPLLVAIVSIRHLTEINDTLGYQYGDGLLAALGARLRDRVQRGAVPARLGGAEIALLLPFDGHLARAEQSVRDLLAAVSSPVRVAAVEVELDLSAGIAVSPMHATDSRDLLRCAGDALRRAKATESDVEVYDPAQDIGRGFGPRLLPELSGALDANRVVACFQPKVDLASGAAVDLEASLRWQHPEHGVIDSTTLRPLAARAGLTRRLTRVLLGEAVQRCAWWQRGGVRLGVSVDLATADVLDSRLPYELARLTSEAGIAPNLVQLELAEDLLLVDPGRTRRALGQFRTLGVRLALDHYGKSAPSLTRLRTMPVQELKLDRSFVASVLQSGPDEAVVRSTVNLAQSLGIQTVADGVDTTELLSRVRSYGCRGVQGGAVGPSMSVTDLAGWLGTADLDESRTPQPIG